LPVSWAETKTELVTNIIATTAAWKIVFNMGSKAGKQEKCVKETRRP